jgi:hypothetical protein
MALALVYASRARKKSPTMRLLRRKAVSAAVCGGCFRAKRQSMLLIDGQGSG